jgi:hypothetical protein
MSTSHDVSRADKAHPLFELLARLDAGHYHYTLSRQSADSVQVTVNFVGERTEVNVFDDGHMEVSRFLGTEDVLGGGEYVWQIIRNNEQRDQETKAGHT